MLFRSTDLDAVDSKLADFVSHPPPGRPGPSPLSPMRALDASLDSVVAEGARLVQVGKSRASSFAADSFGQVRRPVWQLFSYVVLMFSLSLRRSCTDQERSPSTTPRWPWTFRKKEWSRSAAGRRCCVVLLITRAVLVFPAGLVGRLERYHPPPPLPLLFIPLIQHTRRCIPVIQRFGQSSQVIRKLVV